MYGEFVAFDVRVEPFQRNRDAQRESVAGIRNGYCHATKTGRELFPFDRKPRCADLGELFFEHRPLRYSLGGKLLQSPLVEIGRAARRFSERKKQLPRSAGVRIARISLRNVYRTDGLCPARRGQYNYLVIDPPNNIGGFSDRLDERTSEWGEPFRRS